MLQAGRLLGRSIVGSVPACSSVKVYFFPVSVPASHLSRSMTTQTQNLPKKPTQKGTKRRKPPKTIISAENNATFKDLKGKIIALRARELNILAGNLGTETAVIANPAHILNLKPTKKIAVEQLMKNPQDDSENKSTNSSESTSFPAIHKCPNCNKEFMKSRGLKTHSKRCKMKQIKSELNTENKLKEPPEKTPVFDLISSSELAVNKIHSVTHFNAIHPDQKPLESRESPIKLQPSKMNQRQEFLHLPLIRAYLDLYISRGRVDEALEQFRHLRSQPSSREAVENLEIYNMLIRGFARKYDFSKVQVLWKDLIKRNIEPDINSYISSMIALSCSDMSRNVFKTVFRQVYSEFEGKGYTVDSALRSGRFQFDDRRMFLDTLRSFSGMEPVPFQDAPYSNSLLDKLPTSSDFLESQIKNILKREDLGKLLTRQMETEEKQTLLIPSVVRDQFKVSKVERSFISDLEEEWRQRLTQSLSMRRKAKIKMAGKEIKNSINKYMFLFSVPIPVLVEIMLASARHMIFNCETYSISASHFSSKLGNDVMNAFLFQNRVQNNQYFKTEFPKVYSRYLDWYTNPQGGELTHRAALQRACADFNLNEEHETWPEEVRFMVGRELRDIFIKELCITRDKKGEIVVKNKILVGNLLKPPTRPLHSNPAFFKLFRSRKEEKQIEETKPHPSLSKLFSNLKMADLEFAPMELPMVCPPLPWISTETGSFMFTSPGLVRISEKLVSDQNKKLQDLAPGMLSPVLDSLNQLSSVPWKVNKTVLDLAISVFVAQKDNSLLSILNLPLHPCNIPGPEVNNELQNLLKNVKQMSPDQMKMYKQHNLEKSAHNQIKRESYSLWCDTVYRLSIANHFKNDVLWFPHNMDFRGRVYPIPPYFNHMGSDLARSLLVFARGKPLGCAGLNWLKLHCINLTGLKKRESVEERLKFAEEILDLILDSANNPITGKRWFLDSDEPFQTFATCVEIRNALNHPEGAESYVCHLPIHQDGSCNGLQHYAAIGRDLLGAAAVNLVPAEKPQDVYSEIATIVERKRREDAEQGVEIAQLLDGFVKRKVVKQTVMTTVYGVTPYGASKQIARQLKDISEYPEDSVDAGSKYLSNKTFESLNELFTASQEIQDWLTECAKVISGECNLNVEWITPLGFPVVQPYTKCSNPRSTPFLNQKLIMNTVKKERLKVMTMKHRNGFPPNFIHSLDSTHMMLTSLFLWANGITFASVHDCFWTHACDVELMNRTCREQFVALHSQPILEDLSRSFLTNYLSTPFTMEEAAAELRFKQKYPGTISTVELEKKKREILFKNIPKKGSLDLNVVKNSVYFFN